MENKHTEATRFRFGELVKREEKAFSDPATDVEVSGLAADEPWVTFTPRDRFGLALSGGGIRSASFNLGVLQALARKGVLSEVHYLSTVSGGGYIGGFWTALRAQSLETQADAGRAREAAEHLLAPPRETDDPAQAESEPDELRHLRQNGRFLIPRVGFSRSETWTAVLALLLGMIPTSIITASLLAVCAVLFFALNLTLRSDSGFSGPALGVLGVVSVALAQFLAEPLFLASQRTTESRWKVGLFALLLATPVPAVIGALCFERQGPAFSFEKTLHFLLPADPFAVNWALALPALIIASTAALLAVLRIWFSRAGVSQRTDAIDRFLSRSLATAILWLVGCAVWEAARFVLTKRFTIELGGTGVVTGGVFLWLREWLQRNPGELKNGTDRVPNWLKPALPRLAATAAATALIIGVVVGVQAALMTEQPADAWLHFRVIAIGAPVVFLLFGLASDTSALGLHGFYRSRIARAFLGARRPTRPFPLTQRQDDDDIPLTRLADLKAPVHLVCCAANHVQGDSLQTLGRGARSVTLSGYGVSLGSFARSPGDLTLAQALTASGAAFNSQMGGVSLQFGRAVSFLMSALNLRLGLWVEHPRGVELTRFQRLLTPLRRLLSEAAGMTRADLALDADKPDAASVDENAVAMHLSDGGHFDNMGLYELVRRHCRFIVVSDATADRDVAFDDFGNALRRVREDFGVEIEIDLAPLRPKDGLSRQHAVVGTIHYDRARKDTGTILYLKPSFVGQEPTDVLQYRTRNAAFPHQGTGDQFYDDVQWESYRRLGEHIASVAMPDPEKWKDKPHHADAIFLLLRQRWPAYPEDQTQTFLQFTSRCSALETTVRQTSPEFAAELFPELRAVLPKSKTLDTKDLSVEGLTKLVGSVMQVAQLMEDVWLASDLDDFASHPLNEGWMAYFHRWTAAPSFRRWWPILRPIYSDGFRNFMKSQFQLNLNDHHGEGRAHERNRRGASSGLIIEKGQWMPEAAAAMGLPTAFSAHSIGYGLKLENPDADARYEFPILPIGHLSFTAPDDETVRWTFDDLRVPPWLVGGGVVARFLDSLINHFDQKLPAGTRLEVVGAASDQRVTFYKSRGFSWADASLSRLVRTVEKK